MARTSELFLAKKNSKIIAAAQTQEGGGGKAVWTFFQQVRKVGVIFFSIYRTSFMGSPMCLDLKEFVFTSALN